jgi:hypothetical protein
MNALVRPLHISPLYRQPISPRSLLETRFSDSGQRRENGGAEGQICCQFCKTNRKWRQREPKEEKRNRNIMYTFWLGNSFSVFLGPGSLVLSLALGGRRDEGVTSDDNHDENGQAHAREKVVLSEHIRLDSLAMVHFAGLGEKGQKPRSVPKGTRKERCDKVPESRRRGRTLFLAHSGCEWERNKDRHCRVLLFVSTGSRLRPFSPPPSPKS